ncbi:MAG: HAD family phosphatase [Acetobacteraceae bacterium]|nr:HAD family phosphatase [Acetobacteraceae bacterium]
MSGQARIALLLADVDGTLVTQDKVLTAESQAAARELRAADVSLAITSGRPPKGMRMLIEPLAIDTVIAGFNGGAYADPKLRVLDTCNLDPEVAHQALTIILDAGLDAWIYTGEDWLVRNPQAPHVAREAFTVQFEAKVVPSFTDAHLRNSVKIVGVSDDHGRVADCEQNAQQKLGKRASATRSQPYYLDITHPEANKGAVVERLSEMLSIPKERIATIGDGSNDALMFRKSGFSIAMGNASDQVKEQAKVVTDTNEHEGFAKAVRRFILGHPQ